MHSLKATRDDGGYLEHGGGNLLIRLAPYFFPTVVVPPLLLMPVVTASFEVYVEGLVGATLFFHLVGTAHETHWRQPDLARSGLILSALVVGTLHLVFLGTILTVVGQGYGGVVSFLGRAFVHVWDLVA